MGVLDNIKPERVMYYFEKLCSIPHGSGNTSKATQMCKNFAEENGLEFIQDQLGNCIIRKKAYKGYENAPVVILQGHLDMVCEKTKSCTIDMATEGLSLKVSGDDIYAEGTTLGGDDGIAVAMMLAILEDKNLEHPELEALFTVDEEIGMIGVTALDASGMRGKYLINLDSEDEGVFTVSCAGGLVAICTLPIKREEFKGECYSIEISGLTGGHSGAEINKGRANADMLLGRLLSKISESGQIRIISVNGGLKDNAIPTASEALIICDYNPSAVVEQMQKTFENEYVVAEKSICAACKSVNSSMLPMDMDSTSRIITALCCYPNGIQSMSLEIDNLVKTSLNLGILKTNELSVVAHFCVRSSVLSEKQALVDRLVLLTKQLGGEVETEGDYPPWEYLRDSKLRDIMKDTFVDMYNREPIIEAIHAGIECGILSGKIPGLECVSIGPDIQDIHTPAERMSISSVQRVWEYMLEVLKRIK